MPTDEHISFFEPDPLPPYQPPVGEPPPRLNGQLNDPGYIDSQLADAQAAAPEVKPALTATPLDWDAMLAVPPREWIYGTFLIKRFVSALGAPGGKGKTAYAFAIALSVVTGEALVGEAVHEPGNVWIYNLEDPIAELHRRVSAVVQHYQIERQEVVGRLYIDSGRDRPLVIAKKTRDGEVVVQPVVNEIIAELKTRNIRLLIIDPFIKSHRLEENVNEQVDQAISEWGRVADEAGCSILLVHHFRKGGLSGDAASFRGASSMIDAARSALTLSPMSEDEAEKFGIEPEACWQYVRVDSAKLNLAPPPESAFWLKLESQDIGNGGEAGKSDHIQVVERWVPDGPAWGDMPPTVIFGILDQIETGPGDNEFYAFSPQAKDRWAGHVIMTNAHKTVNQAKQIIKQWKKTEVLTEGYYASPRARGKQTACARVNRAKVQEMGRGRSWAENRDD